MKTYKNLYFYQKVSPSVKCVQLTWLQRGRQSERLKKGKIGKFEEGQKTDDHVSGGSVNNR